MILAGLFNALSTNSSITALVGKRIFPILLPELATLPAITYQLISATPRPTLTNSGFQRWRVQFDCWGNDYADCSNVRTALRAALEGFSGLLSDGTHLQDAQFLQAIDFFEHDALQYRCVIEFYLFFNFS